MGEEADWKQIVYEQLLMLTEVNLYSVRMTHCGVGLDWVLKTADDLHIIVDLVIHRDEVGNAELDAILEVERLAKVENTDRPIMYFHTKGVSAPHYPGKREWRKYMEFHTIRQWEWNLTTLSSHDCVGVNWISAGDSNRWYWGHFPGTFFITRADWIRKLPDFMYYHQRFHNNRYSPEFWIGSNHEVRPWSLACNAPIHNHDFDWNSVHPQPKSSWFHQPPQLPQEVIRHPRYPVDVTVIVPTIPGRENLLHRAEASISRQTVAPSVIVRTDIDRVGAMATRNEMLNRVHTEYVAFLDDDDELFPEHIESLYDAAVLTKADMVYPGCQFVSDLGARREWPLSRQGDPFDANAIREVNWIPVTTLARTDSVRKAGGFQNFPGASFEDWGLWVKMAEMGMKIVHLPKMTWRYNCVAPGTKGLPPDVDIAKLQAAG